MSQGGTIETIAIELSSLFKPLTTIGNPGFAKILFAQFGFNLSDAQETAIAGPLSVTATAALGLLQNASAIVEALDNEDYSTTIQKSIQTGAEVKQLITGFADLKSALSGAGVNGDIANFPKQLLSFLVGDYFENKKFGPAFEFLGIIQKQDFNITSQDENNPPFTVTSFDFSKLFQWVGDPASKLETEFDWGTHAFDGTKLLPRLAGLISSTGFPAVYIGDQAPPVLDMVILEITPKTDVDPRGLQLQTASSFSLPSITINDDDWQAAMDFKFKLPSGSSMILQPDGKISITAPDPDLAITAEGDIKLTVARTSDPAPFVIVGQPNASRLEFLKAGLQLSSKIDWDSASKKASGTFSMEGSINEGKLVIDTSNGDGFLQKLLSGIHLESDFDLVLGYNAKTGFYFQASSTLEIKLPVHISIGPINLDGLTVGLKITPEALPVSLGVDLRAELGPLVAVVENIGMTATFSFPPSGGNLGLMNVDLGFKPPNGVGLSVDAGIIKGGGFLYFDNDRSEYAGVMELSIAAIVTVKAIGLITTRMPDGSKGFSLLVIITAEFGTGIQLGFGFTLLGVGGLLGLNRTMLLDPIAAGIKTGGINSIMFPPDPVANAARIISDLRTYFPPYEGRFLLGPMLKLGWGTPTLISISFGIIIEIPGNVAIVGVLRINLPDENIPIVVINVGFIGALEFDKSRIWFYAALFDSRILFMTMEGSMGLLMDFSDHPNFVLSVGGFHPAFQPPPLPFPNPTRIHIDVLRTPLARITVENYFAVTSNTVQFGARSELFYGVDGFDIHGNFSFDALFQFSPFHFVIDISFSVGMDVFGAGVFSVNLKLKLQGPAPWNARGTATLSIDLWLFSIDISVDFDISWGEADNPKLPAVDAIPILVTEFNKIDNWRASIPSSSNLLVTLRKLDSDAQKLVLHPLGTLQISQRTIPLDIQVDKVGANDVADAHLFTLKPPAALSGIKLTSSPPQEKFAIAQFQNLSDADKLSRPSFQDFDSGAELAFDGRQIGSAKLVKRIVRYEVKIIDGDDKTSRIRWFKNLGTLFFHWLAGSSVAKCSLSDASKKALVPTAVTDRVQLTKPGYVIASTTDNKQKQGTRVFASEAQARDFLILTISQTPTLTDELHIIPSFETSV